VKIASSFSRLFRQSRYARSLEDENYLTKQNRRELFAVAAVAFAAKHNSALAGQFLVRVAGVPLTDLGHNFVITPQAHACADLLIADQTNSKRYIVEFKVHARTEDKQLPKAQAFTSAQGYCSQMKKRFPNLSADDITYTVLSKQAEFDDKITSGIICRARTWKELIPATGKESSLIADLLDSLGEFDIPVLRLRNIRSMKSSRYAQSAFDIYELLQSILTDFRPCRMDFDSDENVRYCGMPIRLRKQQYQSLQNWLGHRQKNIGWIGYLLPKATGKPELSVWLYFDNKNLQHLHASAQILKRRLPGKTIKPQADGALIMSEPAERVADEKEWFAKTLEIVLKRAVPTSKQRRNRGRVIASRTLKG
jgi:hypothetical protein